VVRFAPGTQRTHPGLPRSKQPSARHGCSRQGTGAGCLLARGCS
jgi:hypothetical protein